MKSVSEILSNNKLSLMIASAFIIASCSSTHYTSNGYDDVYYNSKDVKRQSTVHSPQSTVNSQQTEELTYPVAQNQKFDNQNTGTYSNDNQAQEQNYQEQGNNEQGNAPYASDSASYQDQYGNTYITNNYYSDDYYDYEYAARLKRFHNPSWGMDYYNDYYTNMYWYNHNPYDWGTSIYMGYNWYWPSYCFYRPSWYMGLGYGFGFGLGYGWGMDPFWNPYYSYWGGYYPYNYWGGYYNDYAYYYYNSHDDNSSNSYHHGNRPPISSYSNSGHKASDPSGSSASFGDKYKSYFASEKSFNKMNSDVKSFKPAGENMQTLSGKEAIEKNMNLNKNQATMNNGANKGAMNTNVPVPNQSFTKPTMNNNPDKLAKPDINTNRNINPNANSGIRKSINPSQGFKKNTPAFARPAQRFNRPATGQQYAKPNMNNYYSRPAPKYSKPKTYTSPGYSQPKSDQYYSRPRSFSMPEMNQGNNRSNEYSAPKFDRRSNEAPARNYSAPSNNYSAPAPSRSAPSMNFNNSGGSRSIDTRSGSGNSNGGLKRR